MKIVIISVPAIVSDADIKEAAVQFAATLDMSGLKCNILGKDEITLENDVLRVDGNFAVAWSGTLDFKVEKSTKTLLGSGMTGEGLVNVYRGTGKVLLAPVGNQAMTQRSGQSPAPTGSSGSAGIGSIAGSALGGLINALN